MIYEKKLIDEIDYYIKEAGWGEEVNKVLGWCKEFIENQPKLKASEWTPVSERMPTMEECIKNNCWFILDDGNRRYHGLFDYTINKFVYMSIDGQKIDECAIAWHPYPESYTEKQKD